MSSWKRDFFGPPIIVLFSAAAVALATRLSRNSIQPSTNFFLRLPPRLVRTERSEAAGGVGRESPACVRVSYAGCHVHWKRRRSEAGGHLHSGVK
jgi:hypothetical protein